MAIRFFDMFAGIGGFRSGLEAVGGFECLHNSRQLLKTIFTIDILEIQVQELCSDRVLIAVIILLES